MNYFRQIIFPPLPKKVMVVGIDNDCDRYSEDAPFLNLPYWFEYSGGIAKFMVHCPECNKVYCYSVLHHGTSSQEIEECIKESPSFFKSEWIANCPDNSIHCELRRHIP